MKFSKLLDEYNLTGYRVAKLSGVPNSTIAKLATGQKDYEGMSVRNAVKLAAVFNLSVEEMTAKLSDEAPEQTERPKRLELRIDDKIMTGWIYPDEPK